MPWRRVGFITVAAAIVVFTVALYGGFHSLGPDIGVAIAEAAILALLVGIVILVATMRTETRGRPHVVVLAIAAAGLGLHVYESVGWSSGTVSWGLLLWAMLPYVLCLAISSFARTRRAAIGGALVALILDCYMHYGVFINPKGSTAALGLLFMPLWNTLIFVPVATAITYAILQRRSRASASAP